MRHRDIPAYQGRWFELVEPDTIPRGRMKWMVGRKQALKDYDLFLLKTAARADQALIGFVSDAGTRTLHVRLVDLDTGEPIWMGKARDDVKWQWIYAQRDIGEIALGNLMAQLGFQEANRHGKMMRSGEWPLQVVFAPLHTSQKALVGGYERLIRGGMLSDGLFDGLDMPVGARLSAAERMLLVSKADAVLCGSLMATGKENAVNAVGVALRLIDTSSGRILWAGSANARRVWRKDRFDDLSQTIATDLVAGLAKVKSGAQTDVWANQAEPQDGPGWVNRGMAALERGLLSDAEEAFLKAEIFEDSQCWLMRGWGGFMHDAQLCGSALFRIFIALWRRIRHAQICITRWRRCILISGRSSAWIWRLERLRLIRHIARHISCWVTGLRAMIFTLCPSAMQQPLHIIRAIYHWSRMMLMRLQSWALCCCVWRINTR